MPEIDVRKVPLPKRHPMIIELFDKMKKDEVLTLTNDHNPEGLYFQLVVMREKEFDKDKYEVKEVEKDKWVAKIRKK